MSEILKYKKALNFRANPRYLTRDFIVPLYTGTEPDIYEDKKPNMNDPGMVVDPSKILPKNFTDDMPFITNTNSPEQLELNEGGRVGFELGGSVQDWVKNTYPEVNFDFKKYPNIGVGTSNENYNMVKIAINKKLENPNYFKPSLDKGINNIADAFLKSYAKDDVSYLTSKSEFNKNGMLSGGDVSFFNYKSKGPTFVQDIVDKTGLKAEDVLDLIDERENFIELDIKPTIAGQTKIGNTTQRNKMIDQGEDWLIKNSKNYDNVEDLKKGFKRVLGKDHPFLKQTLTTSYGMPKLNPLFYEGKQKVYQTHGAPSFAYGAPEMKNLFQASLYNFNSTVRDKVLNELNDILPKTKITEGQKYDLRKRFENSKTLSELGINKRLSGPVTRLLIKDLGENIVEDINFVKTPRLQVGAYINFLKDKVDPKYKKQFELVNKAIRQLNYKNYNGAKDTLGIVENINLDHRVPKYLIDAGYADEIEYIKLNPIGENFNTVAKNKNFDQPIARLSRQYEAATTVEEKTKIIQEMNELKDSFNKRYNNYLSDISIKEIDGKLNVSSSLKPITSANEFIKTLETNVKQNPELFKILNKIENVKTKSAIDIADELSKEDARAVCGKLNLGGLPKGCAELAKEDPEKFIKTAAETTKNTSLATKAKQTLNFFSKVGVVAEEVGSFGRGVAGRTLGPLVALNSALEQWTAGNIGEGFRQIGDLLDPSFLIGDPLDFEKSRQEGSIQNIRSRIGEKNQESFNRILEYKDAYDNFQRVNSKLESFIDLKNNPSIETPPISDEQIQNLQNEKFNLEKILDNPKYANLEQDHYNVGVAFLKEGLSRNVDKPDSFKYTNETTLEETFRRGYGSNFFDLFENTNKKLLKNKIFIDEINKKQSQMPVLDNLSTFGGDVGPITTPIDQTTITPQQKTEIPFVEKQEELPSDYTVSAAEGGYIDYVREYRRYARGGRIHLGEGGGGPKFSRRGFLGFLAGAAASPFVIKAMKGKKFLPGAKAIKALPAVQGMPDWFNPLVTKIMKEGTDISPKATRVEDILKVKKLEVPTPDGKGTDTIVMTEYPDGKIEISADVYGGSYDSPFDLVYKPPKSDIDFTTGKAINEPGNFSVIEQRPKPDYGDPGNFEIDYESMSVEDAISDLERVEKIATGKRIPPQRVKQRTGARKFVEENPSEDIVNRYGDSEIEYDRMKDEGLFDD